MKYALSMYLGGTPIMATDADHETYKELGLQCPFCSQPVFFRSGALYERRDGKRITVPPSFAHFKAGNGAEVYSQEDDCELRSKTKGGEKDIQLYFTKARNQRLKAYNDRLTNLLVPYFPLPIEKGVTFKQLKRRMTKGIPYLKDLQAVYFRFLHREFKQNFEFWLEEARAKQKNFYSTVNAINVFPTNSGLVPAKTSGDLSFGSCVLEEVLHFLSTSASGYGWNDLCLMTLYKCHHRIAVTTYEKLGGGSPLQEAKVFSSSQVYRLLNIKKMKNMYLKELPANKDDALLFDLVECLAFCDWEKITAGINGC